MIPFQFPDNRERKAECNQSDESKKRDAEVADEGEDEGEGGEAEENVGKEVTRSLKPLKEAWLHHTSRINRPFLGTNPPITAALKRIQLISLLLI